MKAKLFIVVVFIIAVAGILWFVNRGGAGSTSPGPDGGAGGAGGPTPAVAQTEISFVYSTEKKEWVEAQVAAFSKANPDVKVTLQGKGSLDASQQILDGKLKPTLFSPADSLVMNLFDADWQTQTKSSIFLPGEDAPQPLVLTPLVFVGWQDRAEALQKAEGGKVTWKAIHKAVTSAKGWPAVGGKPEWGFVKLGHTDPTRSNSGLQALALMTMEFYGKQNIDVGDLLKPDYQAFVTDIEKGVPKFETSTGTFMTDMIRFGPSKYDIAVVYENLAISQVENAQGRWGNLQVYYPSTTLWSDHPLALLNGDWVTDAQKSAGRRLVKYLRGKDAQQAALAYGFRPADPSVPVKTNDPQNPWVRLTQYGIQIDVPTAAPPPPGPVVKNLQTMWSRLVGAR